MYNFKTKVLLNLSIITSLCFSTSLFALPTVDQVVNGNVNISQATGEVNALQINQVSDKAIINWHNFNIAAQESVHFQQPVNGVCLNRIDAANGMSQIAGNLSATANIILVNQSGILITDTARVNVGGIIASAIDTSNDNFLNYKPLAFDQTSNIPGAIINKGVINVSDHGLAALLGAGVANDGVIVAKSGKVTLQSGSAFTVDFFGDGIINYAVVTDTPAPATMAGVDENGKPLANGIDMSGQIISDDGNVIIMASATPGIFDNLINMSGEIQARAIKETTYGVALIGDDYGVVKVTGSIDASGAVNGIEGREILVTGNQVIIDDNASLNVSGDAGWGWIALGDCAGEVDMFRTPYSKSVYVGPNVTLTADAYTSGHGGGIYIRSNEETKFLGTANARGGSTDNIMGGGGYIEIASKGKVEFREATAKVDVSAANGKNGEVMIAKHY